MARDNLTGQTIVQEGRMERRDMPGMMHSAAIPGLSLITVLGKAVGMGLARAGM